MYSLLLLENFPIFEQLQLEEALLRADSGHWVLINNGTQDAVVMGISGKAEKLVDVKRLDEQKIPLIRRFSGGGTVFVDENCFFVTVLGRGQMTPTSLFAFMEELYAPLFPEAIFRENDLVLGDRKFGGHAQYIQKDGWLHHSSFLWDFSPAKMNCLLLPEKQPGYREGRSHEDFLTSLSAYHPCRKTLLETLKNRMTQHLGATLTSFPHPILRKPHRKSTQIENLEALGIFGSRS